MARKKTTKPIDSYRHDEAERVNNPPVGLVDAENDPDGAAKAYRHVNRAVFAGPPPATDTPEGGETSGEAEPEPADGDEAGEGLAGSDDGDWRDGLDSGAREHDPHIDPELSWAQKGDRDVFDVPTVSLHVHERIDPRTIIEAVRKRGGGEGQESLFEQPEENRPLREAVEFYKHRQNWANRLIAGDSLQVMNSLLQKEGMGGEVQTVYIDPPYGIKYGSNFQPFTGKREVNDTAKDLTREPEMIRAFRDTWEMGIHSYLNYMRDRLLLARELLNDTGSCFVQIGDENVHRVALLMDEVFGIENRCATISYATTGGSSTKRLPEVADYLLWYAKDIEQVKYRQLYEQLDRAEIVELFSPLAAMVEISDGSSRRLTTEERINPDEHLPAGARIWQASQIFSQGHSTTGRSEPYEWQGHLYRCPETVHWTVSHTGLDRLADMARLFAFDTSARLYWKRYEEEVPGRRINNLWHRLMRPRAKRYVVETGPLLIQRCILMTSDPGDLVFDPTCGSGTTAYVAEQWGRRWITCDTSRVALTLARQRLMTATFPYYTLAQPGEGVDSGFMYHSVGEVSAASLAYDEPPQVTTLYDQPEIDKGKHRVAGPFNVEAVPSPVVIDSSRVSELEELDHGEKSAEPPPQPEASPADASVGRQGESARQTRWTEQLLAAGVRGKHGERLEFTRLEPLAGRHVHAVGEIRSAGSTDSRPEPPAGEPGTPGDEPTGEAGRHNADRPRPVAVVFGPEHAPLEQRLVEQGLEEARTLVPKPEAVVFAAFAFDPEAQKDIDQTNWRGVTLLRAEMNTDLQTDDLKSKGTSDDLFWLVGRPEVKVESLVNDRWKVKVLGFDYFDVATGEHISGGASQIAAWMLDPDYDGRSLFPRQVFFPADPAKGWQKLAKTLKSSIDETLIRRYEGTASLPFEAEDNRRIAVKIIDDRGIESLVVHDLPDPEPSAAQGATLA